MRNKMYIRYPTLSHPLTPYLFHCLSPSVSLPPHFPYPYITIPLLPHPFHCPSPSISLRCHSFANMYNRYHCLPSYVSISFSLDPFLHLFLIVPLYSTRLHGPPPSLVLSSTLSHSLSLSYSVSTTTHNECMTLDACVSCLMHLIRAVTNSGVRTRRLHVRATRAASAQCFCRCDQT